MNKLHIIKNNMQALKNYHSKRVYLSNLPTYFWLEPTNHCNLRCIMCPNGAGRVTIEKGYMPFEFYKDIIDEITTHASAITLAVNGESLLHPRFYDMVRYGADKGIKLLLNTNATLLSHDKAKRLIDSGISSISFAFDGFNKSMYEKARVGANFESTLDNILFFLNLKKDRKSESPYTVLSILSLQIKKISTDEKLSFLKQFDGLVNEVRLRQVSSWGSTFNETKAFSYRRNLNVYPPCSRLWSTSVIAWNGNVVPCVYNANHEYVIGNLRQNRFEAIWNSDKMMALRQGMIDGSYLRLSPLCENCIVLGTPRIIGIPSGLRLTLSDAATNIMGFDFEKTAIAVANILRKGKFSSKTTMI